MTTDSKTTAAPAAPAKAKLFELANENDNWSYSFPNATDKGPVSFKLSTLSEKVKAQALAFGLETKLRNFGASAKAEAEKSGRSIFDECADDMREGIALLVSGGWNLARAAGTPRDSHVAASINFDALSQAVAKALKKPADKVLAYLQKLDAEIEDKAAMRKSRARIRDYLDPKVKGSAPIMAEYARLTAGSAVEAGVALGADIE